MKNLGISFGLSFVASTLLFVILYFTLSLDAHAAYGIAGLPFIASTHLCELLERREGKKQLANPTGGRTPNIYKYDKFAISWPVTVAYGTVILVAFAELLSFVAGVLLAVFPEEENLKGPPQAVFALVLPSTLIAGYLVGRWIGSRAGPFGLIAIFCVAALAAIFGKCIDFAVISTEDFVKLYDDQKDFAAFLEHVPFAALSFLVSGLLGFWRGRRMRLTKYLRYLFSILPRETTDTLLALAYEEAQKISSRRLAA
jgi:hypothetical protein